jgi:hypothetical protein
VKRIGCSRSQACLVNSDSVARRAFGSVRGPEATLVRISRSARSTLSDHSRVVATDALPTAPGVQGDTNLSVIARGDRERSFSHRHEYRLRLRTFALSDASGQPPRESPRRAGVRDCCRSRCPWTAAPNRPGTPRSATLSRPTSYLIDKATSLKGGQRRAGEPHQLASPSATPHSPRSFAPRRADHLTNTMLMRILAFAVNACYRRCTVSSQATCPKLIDPEEGATW